MMPRNLPTNGEIVGIHPQLPELEEGDSLPEDLMGRRSYDGRLASLVSMI